MPQPKSKEQILLRLQTERRRLEAILAKLSPAEFLMPGVVGEWSIKDVLAHLADWEEHFPVWVKATRQGVKPDLDPGLTWKDFHLFNQRIYDSHRDQSLDEVMAYFHNVHEQFVQFASSLSDEELLTPGYYRLTNKGSLHSWLGSYASHDKWGAAHIRKWLKARNE